VHLTLGILRRFQAISYTLAFFWLDGFTILTPASSVPTGQTVNRWTRLKTKSVKERE
jgi:hypothetical protein